MELQVSTLEINYQCLRPSLRTVVFSNAAIEPILNDANESLKSGLYYPLKTKIFYNFLKSAY